MPLRWEVDVPLRLGRGRVSSSPGTRENSLVLAVISMSLRASAIPAIITSYGPMGVPARANNARNRPVTWASS
jgi:hypothetical protein